MIPIKTNLSRYLTHGRKLIRRVKFSLNLDKLSHFTIWQKYEKKSKNLIRTFFLKNLAEYIAIWKTLILIIEKLHISWTLDCVLNVQLIVRSYLSVMLYHLYIKIIEELISLDFDLFALANISENSCQIKTIVLYSCLKV